MLFWSTDTNRPNTTRRTFDSGKEGLSSVRLTRKANPIQKQKGSSLLTQCCEGFSGTRYGRSLTREGPGSLSSSSKQRVDPTDSSVQLNIWIAHMNPQVFYDLHIYCVQTLFSLYVTYTINVFYISYDFLERENHL